MTSKKKSEPKEKPENVKHGIQFWPVPIVRDVDMAFGMDEKEYFSRHNRPYVPKEYEDQVQKLFFSGGHLPELKPEVDREAAYNWLRAALSSWAPAHEAKITTVAYALWNWVEGDHEPQ